MVLANRPKKDSIVHFPTGHLWDVHDETGYWPRAIRFCVAPTCTLMHFRGNEQGTMVACCKALETFDSGCESKDSWKQRKGPTNSARAVHPFESIRLSAPFFEQLMNPQHKIRIELEFRGNVHIHRGYGTPKSLCHYAGRCLFLDSFQWWPFEFGSPSRFPDHVLGIVTSDCYLCKYIQLMLRDCWWNWVCAHKWLVLFSTSQYC